MKWKLDGSSVGRELKTGAGPSKRERSLSADVAYDVQRVLYRKWIIAAIEYMLKLLLVVLCGWLMWRGIKSLLPEDKAAVPVVVSVPESAQEPVADTAKSASGVPLGAGLACAVLLLPIVTMPFIRVMVSKRSNGVNALTLGSYTAIDTVLAYFMVGASLEKTSSAVLFAGAAVFALIYNVAVMNYALRLEDDK